MENAIDVVLKRVRFMRARALNHRQFKFLLQENEDANGLSYHCDIRWLSRGVVLRRLYELGSEIQMFMQQKRRSFHEPEDNERV